MAIGTAVSELFAWLQGPISANQIAVGPGSPKLIGILLMFKIFERHRSARESGTIGPSIKHGFEPRVLMKTL